MGKASRDKGARGEREVARIFREAGFEDAARTGEWKPDDVIVTIKGEQRKIEVKLRAKGAGAGLLYEAIEKAWAVAHKADRREYLITLRIGDLIDLAKSIS